MRLRITETDGISKKDRLLRITLGGLDEKYPYGLYEWLKEHNSQAYEDIVSLEDEIDNNFADNGSVKELKALLRAYWIAHMEAIFEYTDSEQ